MLTMNLALVSDVEGHDPSDLARVAAALQRQATRDFGPIWKVGATVDALPRLEDVPVGYWPMIVVPDVKDAAGIHLDQNGQPYALIEMSDSWSLTASHEMLEMLADPFGKRLVPGRSPAARQGRVEFLVEVCDPCEGAEFAYTVNDVLVSDFYTPHFFDPVRDPRVRYSFTGSITQPRQVLRGGYLSWLEPVSGRWWQRTWFDGQRAKDKQLRASSGAQAESLRVWIDQNTPHPGIDKGLKKSDKALKEAVSLGKQSEKAGVAKAAAWREQYGRVIDAE
jgi:hypothetical protein